MSKIDNTKIPIAFSPTDFFYLTVGKDMPNQKACDQNTVSTQNCKKINDANFDVCYQKELCSNRDMADTIFVKRNSHSESHVKLNDIYSQYMNEYMKTINLGVGIILSLAFIYYNH